jgi:NADH dehydrogenase
MQQMLGIIQRRRLIVGVPFAVARIVAFGLDAVQAVTLGLVTNTVLTGDQVRNLRRDNVVAEGAMGFGELGIRPTALGAVLPDYMWRYRPSGQYAAITRSARNLRG